MRFTITDLLYLTLPLEVRRLERAIKLACLPDLISGGWDIPFGATCPGDEIPTCLAPKYGSGIIRLLWADSVCKLAYYMRSDRKREGKRL